MVQSLKFHGKCTMILAALLLAAMLLTGDAAYYIPGVTPNSFQSGEQVRKYSTMSLRCLV